MQLYALDHTTPISATQALKGKDYLCPECRSTVRKREGDLRQAHFYHPSLPKQCRQHQKSLEHIHLQLKLFELLGSDGQMECPFPSIKRIADVAWHAKKIVFEVQCSPISREEAQSRTLDYQKEGYTVLWILHDRQFNKKTLSASESYLRTTPCYFTNINKLGQGVVYDQFEVLKKSRRVFKGPSLTVFPTKIISIPHIDIQLPQLLLNRKYCAQGDLLHRILNDPQSIKKMLYLENRTENKQRLPLHKLLQRAYYALLNLILRKI